MSSLPGETSLDLGCYRRKLVSSYLPSLPAAGVTLLCLAASVPRNPGTVLLRELSVAMATQAPMHPGGVWSADKTPKIVTLRLTSLYSNNFNVYDDSRQVCDSENSSPE